MTFQFLSTDAVVDSAGQFILDAVGGEPDTTLLLLSGGSAVAAYTALADAVRRDGMAGLAIGQIDERYGEPRHADSNELAIERATGLVSACPPHSVSFFSMLDKGGPMAELADRYDDLTRQEAAARRIIAVVGIGPDGHTAGILPMEPLRFDEVFTPDRFVVGYDAPGPFRQRITVTPELLLHCATVIVVASGEQKTAALQNAFMAPDEPTYKTPAEVLRRCQNVHVFSDIEIRPGG
jgi:6-phosphogluconolactonase/glucosamine-6-phosphate isomerase/deaminase